MESIWDHLVQFFATASADVVLKIIGALVILLIGFKAIKLLFRFLERSLKKSKLDKGIQGFIQNAVSILLKLILVISVLIYLGVPAASFIAILSSAGLAIGLALQGSLSNFAGGLMILFFRPFRVGDYISTASVDGVVQNISIMYTTLKTLDGKKVVIPNATLSNGVITDATWYDTRRVDVSVTVDFQTDTELMRGLLLGAARDNAKVLSDPEPAAFLEKILDGLPVYTLRCWVNTPDWWGTNLALQAEVKERLAQNRVQVRGPLRECRTFGGKP